MNNVYQSIWNAKSGTFVAASEHAKSGGKKTASASNSIVSRGVGFALKSLAASVMLAAGFNAYALPTDGSVSAGSASIASGAGSTTITQTTQNVSINWQSFNIAQGESVNFAQPNSSAIALNRVVGSDPSSILGSLNANGTVFLINPNGVLFGQSAAVNVGGLVASTRNLSDSDFMAGNYNFAGTGGGSVINQGSINADGGYVALLGANVSNQGVIQANLGTVALAAGDAITLDVAGDGLLNVAVDQGAVDALVRNGGMIQADGGKVLMTARSAGDLFQSAVNNTGVIRAQSIENRNGTIVLLGDMQSGTINLGGTLDVSGSGAGETGGSVTATAQQVGLVGAKIDASGDAGGGTVLLGGGYQGKNPAVQNARATYMSADSSINADAITAGDGGTVVLWGNESTRAYGSITARGGAQSGNGGLIETSGGWLDVSGIRVNTSAANGIFGMWLLDPADITISSAATSGATSTGNVFAPDSGVNVANINVADLVTALGGSNITVTTENTGASGSGNGDITVMNAITWVAPTTLTLNADRDVNVNLGADITATLGSLVANAGRDINVNADVTTTTGNLSFIAVNDVNVNAATTITTGNLTAVAGQNVNLNAAMTVTTGDVILRADNNGTGPGAILGGTVLITCGINCITIGTGDLSIRFNPVTYAQTNAEILAYGLNLTGGGDLDAKAWVFGLGDNKVYDGLRDATVSGLEPDIAAAPPPVALGAVTNALFDTQNVGVEKLITYESTFFDAVFELFAPFGTALGTYVTRADITPAPLTITANNATKVFGDTLVLGTTAFTSQGLVLDEKIGGVTLTSPGTVATASVDGNPYAITPSDAVPGTFDPGNYSINYVNGTLLISAAPPGSTPPGSTPPGSTPPDSTPPDLPTETLPTETLPGVTNPSTTSPYDDVSGRPFVSAPPRRAAGLNFATEGAGVNLQAAQLAQLTPVERVPLIVEEEEPPVPYLAPVYPPRQDRN
ncbi:filamentous hemagglutinin N-terminal domain-containing protein [Pseudomonas sp.]|uniref:two-partner secretion domain-containing protein n=1 Tax=Pseudomonas sp. TaxID=306 RepID=UPI00260E791F|nr:filamentous hemagglutinin N-terminal domain-containing protein [Pseudomonas sp.]